MYTDRHISPNGPRLFFPDRLVWVVLSRPDFLIPRGPEHDTTRLPPSQAPSHRSKVLCRPSTKAQHSTAQPRVPCTVELHAELPTYLSTYIYRSVASPATDATPPGHASTPLLEFHPRSAFAFAFAFAFASTSRLALVHGRRFLSGSPHPPWCSVVNL
jgi:hypothetical protein